MEDQDGLLKFIFMAIAPLLLGVVVFFIKRYISLTDDKFEKIEEAQEENLKKAISLETLLKFKFDEFTEANSKINSIETLIIDHKKTMKSYDLKMLNTVSKLKEDSKEVLDTLDTYTEIVRQAEDLVLHNDENFERIIENYKELSDRVSALEDIIKKAFNTSEINTDSLNKVMKILLKFSEEIKKLKDYKEFLIKPRVLKRLFGKDDK
jgi:methyl-accepting chemotaxis protein